MSGVLSAGFLLSVIVAGTVLALFLLLSTVGVRLALDAAARRRAEADRLVRPRVVALAAGDAGPGRGPDTGDAGGSRPAPTPAQLTSAQGSAGRAIERVILAYLPQVRGEAHYALTRVLERRGMVARTIRVSRSVWAGKRSRAAEALGIIATPAAQHRLLEIVAGDRRLDVRIVATRALGRTGSATAATTLLGSVSRSDPVPEGVVASALLDLGPEAVHVLRAVLVPDDAADSRQQTLAAEVLGLLDDLPAWQALVHCLARRDQELRLRAVRALGRLGVQQAVGPLLGCLGPAEEPAMRAVAARALGMIGDVRAAPSLGTCLSDSSYWVAHNAAEALAALGDDGALVLAHAATGRPTASLHAREALARQALAAGRRPLQPQRREAMAQFVPAAPGSTAGGWP